MKKLSWWPDRICILTNKIAFLVCLINWCKNFRTHGFPGELRGAQREASRGPAEWASRREGTLWGEGWGRPGLRRTQRGQGRLRGSQGQKPVQGQGGKVRNRIWIHGVHVNMRFVNCEAIRRVRKNWNISSPNLRFRSTSWVHFSKFKNLEVVKDIKKLFSSHKNLGKQ